MPSGVCDPVVTCCAALLSNITPLCDNIENFIISQGTDLFFLAHLSLPPSLSISSPVRPPRLDIIPVACVVAIDLASQPTTQTSYLTSEVRRYLASHSQWGIPLQSHTSRVRLNTHNHTHTLPPVFSVSLSLLLFLSALQSAYRGSPVSVHHVTAPTLKDLG